MRAAPALPQALDALPDPNGHVRRRRADGGGIAGAGGGGPSIQSRPARPCRHMAVGGVGIFRHSDTAGPVAALRRPPTDRPKPLAAQFALPHADWLAIHPAPCSLMTAHGVVPALPGLACAARSPCSRSGGCGPQSIPLAQAARTPPHHAIRPHAATRARRASPSLPRRTSPKDHDHSPGSRFAFPTAVGYSGG